MSKPMPKLDKNVASIMKKKGNPSKGKKRKKIQRGEVSALAATKAIVRGIRLYDKVIDQTDGIPESLRPVTTCAILSLLSLFSKGEGVIDSDGEHWEKEDIDAAINRSACGVVGHLTAPRSFKRS